MPVPSRYELTFWRTEGFYPRIEDHTMGFYNAVGSFHMGFHPLYRLHRFILANRYSNPDRDSYPRIPVVSHRAAGEIKTEKDPDGNPHERTQNAIFKFSGKYLTHY